MGPMPRFYFDTDDGAQRSRDEEGLDLSDSAMARREAIGVLPDIAREELPDGDHRAFTCHVRDESGAVIFTATLSLNAEWTNGRRA
jgi:hypothetical protein